MWLDPVLDTDLDAVKASVDLLDLVSAATTLRRESASSYAGPCPWCGGTDRFVVRPLGDSDGKPPAFWCRSCSPKPGSAIDYVARREGLTFREAADWLAEQTGLASRGMVDADALAATRARIAESEQRERAERAEARKHLSAAYREVELQAALRRHEDVIRSLVAGGVSEAAIATFGWGWTTWGGRPALTIPWRVGKKLEAVQYRLLDATTGDKYRWSTGTSGSIWNGAAVLEPVDEHLIVCEGAKKAAAVWSIGQQSVVAVPNNGSAARILAEYAEQLARFARVYVILDPDSPREAWEAAARIGARIVDLPMKVDDYLVSLGATGPEILARRLHGSRRAT
jgi:hypothetical protein